MTPERRAELIATIARAFPETARILSEKGQLQLSDGIPRGSREGFVSATARLEASRQSLIATRERRKMQGKCRDCERPLVKGSKRFCEEHLKRAREYNRAGYTKKENR